MENSYSSRFNQRGERLFKVISSTNGKMKRYVLKTSEAARMPIEILSEGLISKPLPLSMPSQNQTHERRIVNCNTIMRYCARSSTYATDLMYPERTFQRVYA